MALLASWARQRLPRLYDACHARPDVTGTTYFSDLYLDFRLNLGKEWRARRESNPRPLASEANTLSI